MVNIREAAENDIRAIGHIYTRAFGHTEEVISYFSGFGGYAGTAIFICLSSGSFLIWSSYVRNGFDMADRSWTTSGTPMGGRERGG